MNKADWKLAVGQRVSERGNMPEAGRAENGVVP